jgi:predicted transcriptional regulator
MEASRMTGAVHEITIMRALHQGLSPTEIRLREVMARPLPQVDMGVLLEELYRLLLSGNPAVVVSKEGRPAGIITRSDLMRYYERTGK